MVIFSIFFLTFLCHFLTLSIIISYILPYKSATAKTKTVSSPPTIQTISLFDNEETNQLTLVENNNDYWSEKNYKTIHAINN